MEAPGLLRSPLRESCRFILFSTPLLRSLPLSESALLSQLLLYGWPVSTGNHFLSGFPALLPNMAGSLWEGDSRRAQLDLDLKEPKNLWLAGGLGPSSLKTVYWVREERRDWALHSCGSEFRRGCKQYGLCHPELRVQWGLWSGHSPIFISLLWGRRK